MVEIGDLIKLGNLKEIRNLGEIAKMGDLSKRWWHRLHPTHLIIQSLSLS